MSTILKTNTETFSWALTSFQILLLHFTEKFSRGLLRSMSPLPLVNLHGDHFNQSLIPPTPPKVLWSRSPLTTMLLSNGYDKVMIRPYFTRTLNSIFANWSFIPSFWKLSDYYSQGVHLLPYLHVLIVLSGTFLLLEIRNSDIPAETKISDAKWKKIYLVVNRVIW